MGGWRELLLRYMGHVITEEGTAFLGRADRTGPFPFTEEEIAALRRIEEEALIRLDAWKPPPGPPGRPLHELVREAMRKSLAEWLGRCNKGQLYRGEIPPSCEAPDVAELLAESPDGKPPWTMLPLRDITILPGERIYMRVYEDDTCHMQTVVDFPPRILTVRKDGDTIEVNQPDFWATEGGNPAATVGGR